MITGSDSVLIRQSWNQLPLETFLQKAYGNSRFIDFIGRESSKSPILFKKNFSKSNDGLFTTYSISDSYFTRLVPGTTPLTGLGDDTRVYHTQMGLRTLGAAIQIADEYINKASGDINNFAGKNLRPLTLEGESIIKQSLSDVLVRGIDQWIVDCFQGINLYSEQFPRQDVNIKQKPSHIFVSSDFSLNFFDKLNTTVKMGIGFKREKDVNTVVVADRYEDVPNQRMGLSKASNSLEMYGKEVYHLFVDSYVVQKFRTHSDFRDVLQNADVRGSNNRIISGVVGKINDIVIHELPIFGGKTFGSGYYINPVDNFVEDVGIRVLDNNGKWTGQEGHLAGFDNLKMSRGFIVGSNALMLSSGGDPQFYTNVNPMEHKREAGIRRHYNVKKVSFSPETSDRISRKIGNTDMGVIPVDMFHN